MGLGISILLIAAGAVLVWAVETAVAGVSLNTIGVILMIAGLAGLFVGLVAAQSTRERPPYTG